MNDQPENQGDSAPEPAGSPEQALDNLQNISEGPVFWDDYEDPLYLFAFDHLMDQGYISRFVRGLRPAKQVCLPHYRLCWPYYLPPQETAVPSILRTNDESDGVWGILYQANNRDLSRLEEHLRVPKRYYRKSVIVHDRGGRRISAFCYVLNHEPGDLHKPSSTYLDRVVEAAESRKLPEEWINRLKAVETQ